MGKPSAPSAPDPYATAASQYEYGIRAADYSTALNDVNTVGPTGSTSYQVTGVDPATGAPIRTQTTQLSPEQQALLTGQQNIEQGQQGVGGNFLTQVQQQSSAGEPTIPGVNYGPGVGPVQGSIDTTGVPGIGPTSSYYDYGQSKALAGNMAAIEPALDQQQEQLDASLRNSGNGPGTPAYDNAMKTFESERANAETQAGGAAITAGTNLQNTQYGEEANTNQQLFGEAQQEMQARNAAESQRFGEGTTAAGTSNQAGQTALADYAQKVGIPLNELSAILGGTQVATPSAVAPGSANVSAPDIMSAFQNQYAGELSKYNAGVASNNALYGDAAQLGALAYLGYLAAA